MIYYAINTSQSLYHHGTKGQKWGKRRYQNPDGSLTPEGRKHYGIQAGPNIEGRYRDTQNATMATAVIASKNYVQSGLAGAAITGMKMNIAAGASPAVAALCATPAIAGMVLGTATLYGASRLGQKAINNTIKKHALKKLHPGDENKQLRKDLLKESNRIEKNGTNLKYSGYKLDNDGSYNMTRTSKQGSRYTINAGSSKKDVNDAIKRQNKLIKYENKYYSTNNQKKKNKYLQKSADILNNHGYVNNTQSYKQQERELDEMERFDKNHSDHFNNGGDYSILKKKRR